MKAAMPLAILALASIFRDGAAQSSLPAPGDRVRVNGCERNVERSCRRLVGSLCPGRRIADGGPSEVLGLCYVWTPLLAATGAVVGGRIRGMSTAERWVSSPLI